MQKQQLKDKIEWLKKMIKGLKRIDDVIDIYGMSMFQQVYLLGKFKMLEIDIFDGNVFLSHAI